MADTPETKVKARIRGLLKAHGAYWHSPVQNGMGTPALDFHVCHRGRYCSIEAKAHGKHLTPRQELTKRDIEAAGGKVFVIGEIDHWIDEERGGLFKHRDSGMAELEAWLLGLL
jgi:hypothetical protein